jgi:hypothetical protein
MTPVEQKIEYDPEKASKGGLQAILEFQGRLVSHERIANKFGETRKKFGTEIQEPAPDQIEVKYEDVVVLRVEEGEEEPTLTDNKFNILLNYAKPGQAKSNGLSQWNKGYTDTCKKVYNKLPNELEGEIVQMSKLPVEMTITKDKKEVKIDPPPMRWCFVPMGDITVNLDAKLVTAIEGKNVSAALRAVMQENSLKKFKTEVQAGAPLAGMQVVDGVYKKVG